MDATSTSCVDRANTGGSLACTDGGACANKTPDLEQRRSSRFLLLVTAIHLLYNIACASAQTIPGNILESLRQQANGSSDFTFVILAASSIGEFAGVFLGGWAFDKFPAHIVMALVAALLACVFVLLPNAQGIGMVSLCNALIYLAAGVQNCSCAVLTWTAEECGVTQNAPYLLCKTMGYEVGSLVIALISMSINGASGSRGREPEVYNYSMITWTWSLVCIVAGIAIVLVPSPRSPAENPPDETQSDALQRNSRRDILLLLAGALLMSVMSAVICDANTLPMEYVIVKTRDVAFIIFHITGLAAMFIIARLGTWLPAGRLLVKALLIITAGCFFAGLASFLFVSPGWYASRRQDYPEFLFLGYFGYAFLGPSFSLTISFLSSLVPLTGRRIAVLNVGAACGPLLAGLGNAPTPTVLLLVYFGLMLMSAMGVRAVDRAQNQRNNENVEQDAPNPGDAAAVNANV